jgi:alkylation response protein AidB-like acyl-CoA dehydrogenase
MSDQVVTNMRDPIQKYSKAFATDEDLQLARTLREYVDDKIMPRRYDLDGGFHRDQELANRTIEEVGKGLVDLGVARAFLPEECGGLGMTSQITFGIMMEELGRGDMGIATHYSIIPWALTPAMLTNNKAILKRFGTLYCDDKFRSGCFAMTEPAGGCNIEDPSQHGHTIKTKAELKGDEWIINGEKLWPGGIGISEFYSTVCTTDPDKGDDGIVIIDVPHGTPGLSFGKPEEKMGMIFTEVNGSIYYDDVRVPKEYTSGAPGGEGAKVLRNMLCCRFTDGAMVVGGAQACLEIVEDYLKDRYIMGKAVRERSLHAALIGEMAAKLQAARSYYLNVGYMFDHPEIYGDWISPQQIARSSASKWISTSVGEWVIRECMGLTGSYGYTNKFFVEKYLRDAIIVRIWMGGAHMAILEAARGEYPFNPW